MFKNQLRYSEEQQPTSNGYHVLRGAKLIVDPPFSTLEDTTYANLKIGKLGLTAAEWTQHTSSPLLCLGVRRLPGSI